MLPSQAPPVHDPDEVREAAEEILSRAEFGEPPKTLLQKIVDWIADLFPDRDPPEVTGQVDPGSGGSGLLTLLLLIALVVLLVIVVRALVRQPRRRRSDGDPEPTVEVAEHRTAAAWEREAAAHEADGRWKDALRCRFRAMLEHLVDRKVLDEVPGRTTGELRAEVAARAPGAPAPFAAAADLFDVAWNGDVDTGPDEVGALARRVAEVLAASEPASVGARSDDAVDGSGHGTGP